MSYYHCSVFRLNGFDIPIYAKDVLTLLEVGQFEQLDVLNILENMLLYQLIIKSCRL